MSYLKSVISPFGNLQFLAVFCMLRVAFPLKVSQRRSALLLLCSLIGFALTNGIFNMLLGLHNEFGVFAFIAFVLLNFTYNWLYGFFAMKVKRSQLTGSLLFYMSFLELALLISTTFGDMLHLPRIAGQLLACPLILAVILFIKHNRWPGMVSISRSYWWSVYISLILMNVLITLWSGQVQGEFFALTGIVLLAMNLSIFYFMGHLMRKIEEHVELTFSNQMLTLHLKQMDSVKALLDSTAVMRHEMKGQFFLIESLLKEGKSEEVLRYLNQTIEPQLDKAEAVSTGNDFVDMMLSQKVAEARQHGIPTALNVLLPPNLAIDQQMLCSLLFNLWDNAIEASVQSEAPDISFTMNLKKCFLNIIMRNHIDRSVLESNPELHTSKRDSMCHGIGLRLIRKIVANNRGDMKIYEEDGYFIVDILLVTEVS